MKQLKYGRNLNQNAKPTEIGKGIGEQRENFALAANKDWQGQKHLKLLLVVSKGL